MLLLVNCKKIKLSTISVCNNFSGRDSILISVKCNNKAVFHDYLLPEFKSNSHTTIYRFNSHELDSLILSDSIQISVEINQFNKKIVTKIKPSREVDYCVYISDEEYYITRDFIKPTISFAPHSTEMCPETTINGIRVILMDDHNEIIKYPR